MGGLWWSVPLRCVVWSVWSGPTLALSESHLQHLLRVRGEIDDACSQRRSSFSLRRLISLPPARGDACTQRRGEEAPATSATTRVAARLSTAAALKEALFTRPRARASSSSLPSLPKWSLTSPSSRPTSHRSCSPPAGKHSAGHVRSEARCIANGAGARRLRAQHRPSCCESERRCRADMRAVYAGARSTTSRGPLASAARTRDRCSSRRAAAARARSFLSLSSSAASPHRALASSASAHRARDEDAGRWT